MSVSFRHRFRVWFADHTYRDVSSSSTAAAMTTGVAAQRIVGIRGRLACRAVRADDLGHHGTGEDRCPLCAAKRRAAS